MARVICVGHVNWDVTLRVDRLPEPDGESVIEERRTAGGGSAANVAVGLVGLDTPATLLGSVGIDDHGRSARRELVTAGVDCGPLVVTESGPTAVKYLVVDPTGEVMVLSRGGANEAFSADDLPARTLAGAEHLHLTSQHPGTAAELAHRARAEGVTVSIDPGRRVADRDFDAAIEASDLVFLNDREAAAGYAGDLVADGRTVVVKHGPEGAEIRREATSPAVHEGFPVESVDTTGAGDAFAAGFLASRLQGADDDRALAVANACGALTAGETGARVGLDWDVVESVLAGD
ncbi:carbohydrate kinase family protein [Salinirubrum litoreum]|uniref:Carbohydrate kinase family protein n=1 Tax=Salinirubrum litoreum TaxID=1126234 RepID=A0ABD5R6Q0_9EURY|nr:PfkB family carbohydrate kinase [Salinirubrum litoreum]